MAAPPALDKQVQALGLGTWLPRHSMRLAWPVPGLHPGSQTARPVWALVHFSCCTLSLLLRVDHDEASIMRMTRDHEEVSEDMRGTSNSSVAQNGHQLVAGPGDDSLEATQTFQSPESPSLA